MEPVNTRPVELLYRPAASLRIRPRTRGQYRHTPNLVYAEAYGVGLIMDVFQPLDHSLGLGVVDVISGGWHADRTMLNEHIGFGIVDALCERGITVFAVSPGSLTLFTGLEMVRHIHAAIRHIKYRAETYAVAPDRLGIMGVSAGGHLASLVALQPRQARPQVHDPLWRLATHTRAATVFFPPTDLLDYNGVSFDRFRLDGLDATRLLFREGTADKTEAEIRERLIELSPARTVFEHAPPPFMIVQGRQDPIVPWQQAETLANALRAAGGQADLVYNETGGHVWPNIAVEVEQAADWMRARLTE